MTNYDKWNKFASELSDDEEDVTNKPKVTTLPYEKGGNVTIGPSGYKIHAKDEQQHSSKQPPIIGRSSSQSAPTNGSRGVYRNVRYEWDQDRHEVTLNLFFPTTQHGKLTAKQLHVDYDEDHQLLLIRKDSKDGEVLFEGNLRYSIELSGDRTNPFDQIIEWKLTLDLLPNENDNSLLEEYNILAIILRKKCPIPNATIWWQNVFLNEPQIDVTKIPGRNKNLSAGEDNYQKAHRIFLEKLKTQEKIEVDVDDDSSS